MAKHNYYARVKREVYSDKRLKHSGLRVLCSMLAMSNTKASCFPKIPALIEDSGLCQSSVYKGIGELKALGYIKSKKEDVTVYYLTDLARYNSNTAEDDSTTTENNSTSRELEFSQERKVVYLIEEYKDKNIKEEEDRSPFKLFYDAYPKKRKRIDAQKAFNEHHGAMPEMNSLLNILDRWKATDEWTKESGQYIPYPATWIRAHGWEDEIMISESERRESVRRAILDAI